MNRRFFLSYASAGAVLAGGGGATASDREKTSHVFVLVHGAWHGGWCWRHVKAVLQGQGHRVFTPTLTGLGERSHLFSAEIGLETHIQDLVNLIEWEELNNIVLVAHSYGGMPATGVVDRLKSRIRHIVYLDAGVPTDGDSFVSEGDELSPEALAASEAAVRALAPDGVALATFPAVMFGVPATDKDTVAWLDRRLTPHPLKTWLDPISLPNGGSDGLPRTYIHCTAPVLQQSSFPYHAAIAKADPAWRYDEIATGHDAMVTAPLETARLILAAATAS
ncbi:MAG: alpha/beta fold hydrolase [Pseudomonadota bacterium]